MVPPRGIHPNTGPTTVARGSLFPAEAVVVAMNPPADALTSSGLNFYEWMVDGNGKRVALFDRGDHSGLGTTNRQQTAPQVIPETLTPDGTVKIRQRLTLPASEA